MRSERSGAVIESKHDRGRWESSRRLQRALKQPETPLFGGQRDRVEFYTDREREERSGEWVREWWGGRRRRTAPGPANAGGAADGRPLGLSSSHSSPLEVVPVGGRGTGASIRWAVGGSLASVKLHAMAAERSGGGKRGEVKGFSRGSQRTILRFVNSLDRSKLNPEHIRLITLTYPKEFPSARETKRHLDNIIKRFTRAFGRRAILWKLEPQKRGAPHYHLLVLMDSHLNATVEFPWWAQNWYEVVGSNDPKHFVAGTKVEQPRTWNGVAHYAAKYLTKPCETDADWEAPGRWWGKRHEELFPVQLVEVEIPAKVATQVRRTLIRWFNHQPSGRFRVVLEKGQVDRRWKLTPEVVRLLLTDCAAQSVTPIPRRWPTSRGGCTMFMGSAEFERLVGYWMAFYGQFSSWVE